MVFRSGIDLAQGERMPSKDFADASGMGWRVWNTVPGERGAASYRSDATRGSARVWGRRVRAWVSGGKAFTFRAFVPNWHD